MAAARRGKPVHSRAIGRHGRVRPTRFRHARWFGLPLKPPPPCGLRQQRTGEPRVRTRARTLRRARARQPAAGRWRPRRRPPTCGEPHELGQCLPLPAGITVAIAVAVAMASGGHGMCRCNHAWLRWEVVCCAWSAPLHTPCHAVFSSPRWLGQGGVVPTWQSSCRRPPLDSAVGHSGPGRLSWLARPGKSCCGTCGGAGWRVHLHLFMLTPRVGPGSDSTHSGGKSARSSNSASSVATLWCSEEDESSLHLKNRTNTRCIGNG